MDPSDYQSLPIQYIKLAFHFVEQDFGSGPVNFQCTAPENDYYAPDYLIPMLNEANSILADPAQSNQTSAQDLPDLRLRYVPATGFEDICGSIYFHETVPSNLPTDVMNVVFTNCQATGQVVNGNIYNCQVHTKAFELDIPPGHQDYGWNARVISHELGHILGLCHAHSTTTCPWLDVEEECGNNTHATSCGGDNNVCIFNNSNNVMADGVSTAFVHSQWAYFYYKLEREPYTYCANEENACEEPQTENIEIASNTVVIWECARYIENHIEVRTGATLIISAPVVMAKSKRIIVNRGGRLFLNGGSISGMSKSCFWGGIVVHGNDTLAQPMSTTAKNENIALGPDSAGVVWIKDSKIFWANTGITTRGTGSYSTHNYFGGLVMLDNADFIDCGRAIEFMKYGYPNNSYYHGGNVISSGDVSVSNQGISIWACEQIEIANVVFKGLKDYGVYGINYDAVIDGCYFEAGVGSIMAIGSDNTMPNSTEIPLRIHDITVQDYTVGISANSSPNLERGLIVDKSTFDGRGSISVGISVVGESVLDIYDNGFTNHILNTRVVASGDALNNKIRCNLYSGFAQNSIAIGGANEYLELQGNTFTYDGANRIILKADGYTTIREVQGSFSSAAGNTFTETWSAIVAEPNKTRLFDYYVLNLGLPSMNENERPENNLSDSGDNNYYNRRGAGINHTCDSPPDPPDSEEPNPRGFTLEDLDDARTLTATKLTSYSSDPTNLIKKSEYYDARSTQDSILKYLVREAWNNGQFGGADTLLLGEGNKSYTRGVVGHMTSRGEISAAESLLYTIPVSSQDDQWFRDIMEINFKIELSDTMYVLTSGEEDQLNIIASADTSLMQGYACALLSLCTGSLCDREYKVPQAYTAQPIGPGTTIASIDDSLSLHLYPNPTSDQIRIVSNKPISISGEVYILDLLGRIVFTKYLHPNQTVNEIVELPNAGIYLVNVSIGTETIFTKKVVRQ